MQKKMGIFSIIFIFGFASYLVYQNLYIETFNVDEVLAIEKVPEKTLLLTAEEQDLSLNKNGFPSLYEELKFWSYDKENNMVKLKEESLLPTPSTSILFIYNKAINSLERQENIIPINTFPYSVHQNNTSFNIYNVDSEGVVYLIFQGKHLTIEPGETYRDIWFDKFRIRNIKIKNYGLFNLEQFETF